MKLEKIVNQLLKRKATQANRLIRAKYSFTKREIKLARLIISVIGPDTQVQSRIEIPSKDIAAFLNSSGKKYGSLYKDIEKICQGLNTKPIKIDTKEEKQTLYWIGAHGLNLKTQTYWFSIPKEMQPFLFALKDNLSSVPLYVYEQLSSSYSPRMYELLFSYRNMRGGTVVFSSWQELQDIIGGKHTTYSNFKNRILKPTQKELTEKTFLSFDYIEGKKKGSRAIESLTIIVKYNYPAQEANKVPIKEDKQLSLLSLTEKPLEKNQEIESIIEKTLLSWGLSPDMIYQCITNPFTFIKDPEKREEAQNQYPNKYNYIWDKMTYTADKEGIKEEASFFLSAIRNNYKHTKQLQKQQVKQQQKAKEQQQQMLIMLENERETLLREYHELQLEVMDSLFANDSKYAQKAIKAVKRIKHSGYKTGLSENENVEENKFFRASLLSHVKQKQTDSFTELEKQCQAKRAVLDQKITEVKHFPV